MFPILIGTVVIAGIIGYASEKMEFTRNGYLPSIIICVGAAFLAYFVKIMFGFGFRMPGLNAAAASVVALFLIPVKRRK